MFSSAFFQSYWTPAEISANLVIFLNVAGAMLLGFVVGYERSYHGRAAGMRTYGLVCMASAALVAITGYPDFWFAARMLAPAGLDPTRVIQGIVTGIGFLGAGVIMKEGFTISGLTTAASIWASSAIGILVGVGFYGAAILLAFLSAACMVGVSKLESWLPSRPAVSVTLRFAEESVPSEKTLREMARTRGYDIAGGSLTITFADGISEWRFVAVAINRKQAMPLSAFSRELRQFRGVQSYHLAHARN